MLIIRAIPSYGKKNYIRLMDYCRCSEHLIISYGLLEN